MVSASMSLEACTKMVGFSRGRRPNAVTFSGCISACTAWGRALQLLKRMRKANSSLKFAENADGSNIEKPCGP